jgi:uncharacterized protein YjbI with pentapeptide repeats
MADVFISYAREDQNFVRKLQEALEERDRTTWIDWKDIPLTAEWKEEVYSAIDNANSFAAVISPYFIVSKTCHEELDHAAQNHKRMVPLWHRDVADDEVPPALAAHQYVFFRQDDDFGASFEALLGALDTDLEWVRFHTRLLSGAKEWDKAGREPSFLLRSGSLEEAERWQAREAEKEPKFTSLQKVYILASRQSETKVQRRQANLDRLLLAAALVLIVLMLGAIVFWQWGEARSNAQSGPDRTKVELDGANRDYAMLRNADLSVSSLSGADLSDANLSGAVLSRWIDLGGGRRVTPRGEQDVTVIEGDA